VVFGHGEGLVSGELDPDRYRVGRDGRVRVRRAEKRQMADGGGGLHEVPAERRWARGLRDDEACRVADLVLAAERGLGSPFDVEFCWAGQDLWLVQCRPITTLRAAA
jgi:phosphoenolpyruvate synthase/pyruvate phosphate dikinase